MKTDRLSWLPSAPSASNAVRSRSHARIEHIASSPFPDFRSLPLSSHSQLDDLGHQRYLDLRSRVHKRGKLYVLKKAHANRRVASNLPPLFLSFCQADTAPRPRSSAPSVIRLRRRRTPVATRRRPTSELATTSSPLSRPLPRRPSPARLAQPHLLGSRALLVMDCPVEPSLVSSSGRSWPCW